ncbi:hypothetical protein F4678DRAFT_475061 [Xylaria arbuscula]|nr:hypothetical protein F4678DRAFT_475061 [Xylaria arbuscula]
MEDRSPSPPWPPPAPPPTQYTVLFSEPADQLPAPLPSVDEIKDSTDVLTKGWAGWGRCAVRVGEHFVVKYGADVEPSESDNMIFARQHLKGLVFVPRVFAVYQQPNPNSSKNTTYIIMEYFNGRQLDDAWGTMDESKRLNAVGILRDALQLLRNLPAPDYFGGLGMTKLGDDIFDTIEPDPVRNGPFKTEEELINAIILRYRDESRNNVLCHKTDYYAHVLPQLMKGNGKSVFTHGDLQRKNIMIGDGGEIAILDWAIAWKDDWHSYIPKFLDEYPGHHIWLYIIRLEMWS